MAIDLNSGCQHGIGSSGRLITICVVRIILSILMKRVVTGWQHDAEQSGSCELWCCLIHCWMQPSQTTWTASCLWPHMRSNPASCKNNMLAFYSSAYKSQVIFILTFLDRCINVYQLVDLKFTYELEVYWEFRPLVRVIYSERLMKMSKDQNVFDTLMKICIAKIAFASVSRTLVI